jgi:hypothetical protein
MATRRTTVHHSCEQEAIRRDFCLSPVTFGHFLDQWIGSPEPSTLTRSIRFGHCPRSGFVDKRYSERKRARHSVALLD